MFENEELLEDLLLSLEEHPVDTVDRLEDQEIKKRIRSISEDMFSNLIQYSSLLGLRLSRERMQRLFYILKKVNHPYYEKYKGLASSDPFPSQDDIKKANYLRSLSNFRKDPSASAKLIDLLGAGEITPKVLMAMEQEFDLNDEERDMVQFLAERLPDHEKK